MGLVIVIFVRGLHDGWPIAATYVATVWIGIGLGWWIWWNIRRRFK